MINLQFGAASDLGRKRSTNQDALLTEDECCLFAVADGLGGHAGGETASREALAQLRRVAVPRLTKLRSPRKEAPSEVNPRDTVLATLRAGVLAACAHVYDLAQRASDLAGLGTPLTALALPGARAYVAHVGDSRAYLLRDGKVHRITDDHRVVDELVRRGTISAEEAADFPYQSALSRCVGTQPTVDVDLLDIDLLEEDRFLLCSDGLHEYLGPDDIPRFVGRSSVHGVAEDLVAFANDAGGKDNITAVVLEVTELQDETTAVTSQKYRRMELLRKLPLLAGLEYKDLVQVLASAEPLDYQAGEELQAAGDAVDAVQIILYGSVHMLRSGRRVLTLGPGDSFGEEALLDSAPTGVDLVADEVTKVFCIPRHDLLELMRADVYLSNKLLRAALLSLARRHRRLAGAV